MKKFLFTVLVISACTISINAQTKGTNAIGFGFTSRQTKSENATNGFFNNSKNNFASLTYGRFIRDNTRVGITLGYNYYELRQSIEYDQTTRGYGAGLNYQKYYPLFKKFYAVVGGRGEYFYNKGEGSFGTSTRSKQNHYNLGAYGSAAYFLSKHFTLEAKLLSADINYSKMDYDNDDLKQSETGFNLSSSGALNNLGFNIYFLF